MVMPVMMMVIVVTMVIVVPMVMMLDNNMGLGVAAGASTMAAHAEAPRA